MKIQTASSTKSKIPTRSGPIALVTKFPVHRCRECGEPIKTGERTWWLRAVGTAHLTCGWTLPNGKVHPGTLSSVRDVVPVSTGISEYVPLYARRNEAGK